MSHLATLSQALCKLVFVHECLQSLYILQGCPASKERNHKCRMESQAGLECNLNPVYAKEGERNFGKTQIKGLLSTFPPMHRGMS